MSGRSNHRRSCLGRLLRLAVLIAAFVAGIGILVGAVLAQQYQRFQTQPILTNGQSQTLIIPNGTSWSGVVERAVQNEVVDSAYLFDFWGRRTGLAEEVKAGTFHLEGPLKLEELAEMLRRGGRANETVVILREGLTIFEIADRLEELELVNADEFLDAARDTRRFGWTNAEMESLEGYLFPDTYRIAEGSSAEVIVDRFLGRWQEKVHPLFDENADRLQALERDYGVDQHDIIILASIIERETGVSSERDIIARVFYNRLERGMMLQTDPTCVYGETTYHLEPTPQLCRDPLNRYSTYVIEGLPPGPIANPGMASIEAALLPSDAPEASDYLYFVSRRDGTGEHYFSTNYDEHRRAIQRFLRD